MTISLDGMRRREEIRSSYRFGPCYPAEQLFTNCYEGPQNILEYFGLRSDASFETTVRFEAASTKLLE